MRDNELFAAIIPAIETGLTAQGVAGTEVIQNYQPTQEGVPTDNVVAFYKIADRRYGFLQRSDVWDPAANDGDGAMVHTENQWYVTTFQVNALALQDPEDTSKLTASDLLNAAAHALQSDAGRAMLREAGIGVLRVMDIRNTPFVDDRDNNEFNPSFDFTVTHQQVIVSTTPTVEAVELKIAQI